MGGEFTYPKMGSQNGFDNHSHIFCFLCHSLGMALQALVLRPQQLNGLLEAGYSQNFDVVSASGSGTLTYVSAQSQTHVPERAKPSRAFSESCRRRKMWSA